MAKTDKELNAKLKEFLTGKFKYDNYGQFIWLVKPDGHHQKIADLRGWGAIQHLFEDKKGWMDTKKPEQLQDLLGEWIIQSLEAGQPQSDESKEVDQYIDNLNLGDAYKLHIRSFYNWYLTNTNK
jgi:hypothetical protein